MRKLGLNSNVDNSDLANYPNGRIKDNTGAGDGTPVSERTKGDIHQFFEKVMRLYGLSSNELPDNELNGFQLVDAVRALASKNDFILTLGSVSGVVTVPVKIGLLLDNESIVCLSSIDIGLETQIKGSDGVIMSITKFGTFKSNEYVRLIKTASTVVLVRIADATSLDLMAAEFSYLKKATQAEENAGAIDTKATTPLTNLVAFTKRIIGADSGNFLATITRNGLMSIADKIKLNNLTTAINVGWFSGFNVSQLPGALAVSGDFLSANVETPVETGTSSVLVTMTNAMSNVNYKVRIDVQSEGTFYEDLDTYSIMFRPVSTTQFRVIASKLGSNVTSLKIHLEVVQL